MTTWQESGHEMANELELTHRLNCKNTMADNDDEISDTAGPGPGPAVADLSAVDRRTTYDDSGMPPANDMVQVVGLPLDGQIQCRKCETMGLNRLFLQEAKFKEHVEEQHPRNTIVWRCTACSKDFPKLHGCRCHLPKCKGRQANRGAATFKCDKCDEMFETKRGVSMHERHRHPEIRNIKRIEALTAQNRNRPGNRASAWSKEEVGLLTELNERFKHLKQPNVAIREFLPGKTLKQISDKRRLLPVREQEAPVEEGSSDESSSEEYHSAGEHTEEIPRGDQTGDLWQRPLREAITADQLEDESEFKRIEKDIHELVGCEDIESKEDEISALVQKFTEQLKEGATKSPRTNKSHARKAKATENARKRNPKTRKRGFEYARHQELYRKCPKKLLDLALTSISVFDKETVNPPCKREVEPLYTSLWGTTGPITNIIKDTVNRIPATKMEDIWLPITVGEVIEKFKRIKAKTAAGADGIVKSHLRKRGALTILTKLCNLLMLSRVYPEQWKLNRTTLIPKPGKSVEEVENWRPITIGSLLGRIYSAMIDRRIRNKTSQNIRQKGFTKEDGCKYNIAILDSALAEMKEKEGGIVTVIDISKAFDTVPHGVIGDALEAKGVPAAIGNYLKDMYKGCRTLINCRDKETLEVALLRGVKQGDPLSPLLFNLTIDPLIGSIDETTEGVKVGDERISILAFADDIVLLAKNREEAQKQARKVYSYLEKLNMSISISKCRSFQVVNKSKTWHLQNPQLRMGRQNIPYADPETIIGYLGAAVSPWQGLRRFSEKEIVDAIKNIRSLKLKPHQKVNLIRTHLLPRYIHQLVANPPSLGLLDRIDQEIKVQIKEILHLHPSTTDGVIYTDKSHGGLGVQRVANIIKLAKLRNALKMRESSDEMVRSAYARQEGVIRKYATSIGLQWPSTKEQIETRRISLRKADTDKWRSLISQGQGVADFFGDKIGNAWLYHPELLKPSRYLDALKLRTNTFGTKVALNRAKKNLDVNCRRCGVQVETLGHILGNCIHTKPMRIKRHNEICQMIVRNLPRHCAVFEEPAVNVLGELKKPDLVIKDQQRLYVVDVTVRYEDKDNLQKAYKQKIYKYKETAEMIRIKTMGTEAEVVPVVVGCRGAMPKSTKENLKRLGLKQKDMLTASLIALRSSLEMANMFIDYDHTR
ncbi:Retrovirus-related Pol polyprotein from type-2 retrotransposable element R2DM [Anthophora retusa]